MKNWEWHWKDMDVWAWIMVAAGIMNLATGIWNVGFNGKPIGLLNLAVVLFCLWQVQINQERVRHRRRMDEMHRQQMADLYERYPFLKGDV